MKNITPFTLLNYNEIHQINGGRVISDTGEITCGLRRIVPFGDPRDWDMYFDNLPG